MLRGGGWSVGVCVWECEVVGMKVSVLGSWGDIDFVLQTVEEEHHKLQEALSKFSLEGGNFQ